MEIFAGSVCVNLRVQSLLSTVGAIGIPVTSGFQLNSTYGVDERRLLINPYMDSGRKSEFGQFFTPDRVAEFMATLFSTPVQPVHLLDPGAGLGSLSAAFLRRWNSQTDIQVTAYEVDSILMQHLKETLQGTESVIKNTDFVQDAVYQIALGNIPSKKYTHAVLNPPYKKINNKSLHRSLLQAVGLKTVNLYAAFVGLALELVADGGEIVAIVPRSFCNGVYFKPFREWILSRASLEHIHLFQSRTSTFRDDDVLQENIIIKLVRGRISNKVNVTISSDTTFSDIHSSSYSFEKIVNDMDDHKFIHIPTQAVQIELANLPLACKKLSEIDLEISTGPIVDFRLKEFLSQEMRDNTVPLLYPAHFGKAGIQWPNVSKKPNAIVLSPETKKWLYPQGFYTVVRRFSSKEEKKRIIANVVNPGMFSSELIGFENHLNVFHSSKKGIEKDVAYGLATFLNSTPVDEYFRQFSGNTQVNATDLRCLKYPDLIQLKQLGRWAQSHVTLSQEMIDLQVRS